MADIVSREQAIERGLSRYFSGLPCGRGHISERSTKWSACLECQSAKHKEWLKANPERVKQQRRTDYYKDVEKSRAKLRRRKIDNPEKVKLHAKRSYQKHREKRCASVLTYYLNNREKCLAEMRRWREQNPEKARAIARKWAQRHYDKIREWQLRNPEKHRGYARAAKAARRARLKECEGKFTQADIDRLYKQQRGRCAYCRVPLKRKFHIDHIVSLADGGSNWPSNLQLCCQPCNSRKSARDPIEYAQSTGRLI